MKNLYPVKSHELFISHSSSKNNPYFVCKGNIKKMLCNDFPEINVSGFSHCEAFPMRVGLFFAGKRQNSR